MTGLDRLPRDRYEVASELGQPDAILLRSYKMHDMEIPDSVLARRPRRRGHQQHPGAEAQQARHPGVQHAGRERERRQGARDCAAC